jgi:hypothetical protein
MRVRFQRLMTEYDEPLSYCAFNINLHRCNSATSTYTDLDSETKALKESVSGLGRDSESLGGLGRELESPAEFAAVWDAAEVGRCTMKHTVLLVPVLFPPLKLTCDEAEVW